MVARNTREQVRRVDTPAAAPLLITDGALVTADAVWAWVLVPIASTFLAEEDDLDQATLATARSLAAVLPPGVDYHLKVIPAPHTGDAYRASWAGFDGVRSPNAEQYIDLGAHRIDLNAATGTYRRKVVLLGIRCPETDPDLRRDADGDGLARPVDRRRLPRQATARRRGTARRREAGDREVARDGGPVHPARGAGAGRDDRLVLRPGGPPHRAAGPGHRGGDRADARRVVPRRHRPHPRPAVRPGHRPGHRHRALRVGPDRGRRERFPRAGSGTAGRGMAGDPHRHPRRGGQRPRRQPRPGRLPRPAGPRVEDRPLPGHRGRGGRRPRPRATRSRPWTP